MTDREAIDVLKMDMQLIAFDPMTGETIDLETVKLRNDLNYKCYLANQVAIAALQERIDREKGCEWCIGFCPDVTGDPYADCWFCPMCGRKLKTAMPGGGGRVDHECSLSRM